MIGQKIDRYDVVERLGQGGMGVVYKARDTLLDRYVALKVLPEDKSSDPERRQRFLGEAKAASALNHPGIVSVYDVVTVDGQDVIVMELVEGETLEQRLSRKRFPLTEALGLGGQIADALGRAHAAGIVHRDLKPANVMLTPEGGVKILDFGLAKLTQTPFMDDEAETLSHHALTAEHVVAGTIGWMSPEQATGQAADARSDVFSFGLVLYEMLTGRHPFRRGTTTETLAAIREDEAEPPIRLNPAVPVEAGRAVLRCLRKEPSRRWQSVSDLAEVLADIKEDSESGRGVTVAGPPRRRHLRWGLVVGAAALVVAAVAAALLLRRQPAPLPPLDLTRLTYDSGLSCLPSISPDGSLVVYSSDRAGAGDLDIWVRQIHQGEPVRLSQDPAHDLWPRFSPDGSKVVFASERDGGGIYVVGALGGPERRIGPSGLFPAFTPDGAYVTYAEDPDHAPGPLLRLFRVPAEGGTPEPFVPGMGIFPPPGSGTGPVWSPDGRLALVAGAPLDDPRKRDWWVVPLAGGEPRSSGAMTNLPTIDMVQFPSLWRPGRLLLLAGTTIEGIGLYRAGISDEGHVSGPVHLLTGGPGVTWSPSASTHGRLALERFQWVVSLWEQKLDPVSGRASGSPRRLTRDAAPKFGLSLTRDGQRLAFSLYAGPPEERRSEIHLRDQGGTETVPVSRPTQTITLNPCLAADGTSLAWTERIGDEVVTFVAPTGEATGREACRGCQPVAFLDGSAELLVNRGNSLSRIRLADGNASPVFELEGRWLMRAALSADERWIAALTSEPEGGRRLRVLPLAGTPGSLQEWIEVAGGDAWVGAPVWGGQGGVLYYLSDRDDFVCVWGRRIDPATGRPTGDPFAVVHAHTMAMDMQMPSKEPWALAVGGDRLVFNAGQTTGELYTALLPSAD
jgi:serine/threonine protein kinase